MSKRKILLTDDVLAIVLTSESTAAVVRENDEGSISSSGVVVRKPVKDDVGLDVIKPLSSAFPDEPDTVLHNQGAATLAFRSESKHVFYGPEFYVLGSTCDEVMQKLHAAIIRLRMLSGAGDCAVVHIVIRKDFLEAAIVRADWDKYALIVALAIGNGPLNCVNPT